MPKPQYILGLNTYDHDVSACLLRDGALAYAIEKERITREKHATGFYKEVIDYVLVAEGITLDDVELVVSNCYILPVPEMEDRLIYQDMPGFLPEYERQDASKHPLFRAHTDKVKTISHHLAHAYSAFAVCPFEEGAIMIVDGDCTRPGPCFTARTGIRELLHIQGPPARLPEEGLDGAGPGLPER
jgi:carbamoyltransferase